MRCIALLVATCAVAITGDSQTIEMAGDWHFSANSTAFGLYFLAAGPITQSGNNLTGQLSISYSPCATLVSFTGTLTGYVLKMNLNESGQTVTFSGLVSADGNSASGTYSAPAGGCTNGDYGTWSGYRTPYEDTGPKGPTGSMAQVASGAGWQTIFTLLNTGPSPGTAEVNFFDDNGNGLVLPLDFLEANGETANLSQVWIEEVPAGGVFVFQTEASADQLSTGSAQVIPTGNFDCFAIFRYNPTGQEAVVPLETPTASAYLLAFDNTGSLATGLAIASIASQPLSVSLSIRDEMGSLLGTDTITLPANGHTSFMLAQTYGVTAGIRGTVEVDSPSGGQITALGLRANGNALTTLPVFAKTLTSNP